MHQVTADTPKTKRVQVSIDGELAHKGRVIASIRGRTLPELIETWLGPIIERELSEAAGTLPVPTKPR